MYGYICGVITKITPNYIIVENNGIGYLITVPNPYNFMLNEYYKIYIYQHVKEDLIALYGFNKEEEKDLFLKLISVSGIGPKTALAIIAAGSVMDIILAIENKNVNFLKKFPGVGAKASQQIILDLAGKINLDEVESGTIPNSKENDVIEALMALGYTKKEVKKVVDGLDMSKDEGTLVKEALKKMVK